MKKRQAGEGLMGSSAGVYFVFFGFNFAKPDKGDFVVRRIEEVKNGARQR